MPVTDRQDDLIRCFCEKIEKESGGSSPLAMLDDPCPKAEQSKADDLEELRTEADRDHQSDRRAQAALDELTRLPAGMKATVDDLAAKVKDLNTRICDKMIDAERAFVMQLHYRRGYVELRHQLTDPRTYVCGIYDLLDELFALYEGDACVAGAIARLEKAKQLEDERKQGKDAESAFIDDVLRCAKPEEPTEPPDDDTDDLDELDPCRCVGRSQPDPEAGPRREPPPTAPDRSPIDGGPADGADPPTDRAASADRGIRRPAEGPPSGGPTTAQS